MIDAHRHYWHYDAMTYPWITDELDILQADFLPEQMAKLDEQQHITGVIAVQARCSEAENDYLLALASQVQKQQAAPIVAIVGWLDFCADDLAEKLAIYSQEKRFKGFRHLVQDEPEPSAFWRRQDFSRGIKLLQKYGITYDLLAVWQDLPAVVDFAQRHDQAPLVLDHLGKPSGQAADFSAWLVQIEALAALPHTAIKLSGLPLSVGSDPAVLTRYWRAAIECFGVERCLWGSDWPVCLLRHSGESIVTLWQDFVAAEKLSANDLLQITHQAASRFYQLGVE